MFFYKTEKEMIINNFKKLGLNLNKKENKVLMNEFCDIWQILTIGHNIHFDQVEVIPSYSDEYTVIPGQTKVTDETLYNLAKGINCGNFGTKPNPNIDIKEFYGGNNVAHYIFRLTHDKKNQTYTITANPLSQQKLCDDHFASNFSIFYDEKHQKLSVNVMKPTNNLYDGSKEITLETYEYRVDKNGDLILFTDIKQYNSPCIGYLDSILEARKISDFETIYEDIYQDGKIKGGYDDVIKCYEHHRVTTALSNNKAYNHFDVGSDYIVNNNSTVFKNLINTQEEISTVTIEIDPKDIDKKSLFIIQQRHLHKYHQICDQNNLLGMLKCLTTAEIQNQNYETYMNICHRKKYNK